MKHKQHKLIIEGSELVGKSFITHELYTHLEPQQTSEQQYLLDGCHWFNCDVGVFGTPKGATIINHYLHIAQEFDSAHIIFEKFHISDQVYSKHYRATEVDHHKTEERLLVQGFKIIFLEIDEDPNLFEKRLQDRLNLYPHYKKIAQTAKNYIELQKTYQHYIEQSLLPTLKLNTSQLPDNSLLTTISSWLEKN